MGARRKLRRRVSEPIEGQLDAGPQGLGNPQFWNTGRVYCSGFRRFQRVYSTLPAGSARI